MNASPAQQQCLLAKHDSPTVITPIRFSNGVVPEPIRFLNAFEMYKDGTIPTKKDAAVVAEMKVFTFKHRTCGRRSAAEYGKTRWLLLDEEEEVLIWRCEISQRVAFRKVLVT